MYLLSTVCNHHVNSELLCLGNSIHVPFRKPNIQQGVTLHRSDNLVSSLYKVFLPGDSSSLPYNNSTMHTDG